MRAAENTIEFVKAWVEGKLTKRQFMHYYIVKTKHAEFLMKKNKLPDLVAIKDANGHIFITDNNDAVDYYGSNEDSRNPLFCLLHTGMQFKYSLLKETSFTTNISNHVSTWRTIETIFVKNIKNILVPISLVEIGSDYYLVIPQFENKNEISLSHWANFEDIVIQELSPVKHLLYSGLELVNGKPKTVLETRSSYLEFAGEQAVNSTVSTNRINIPTEHKSIKDINAFPENIFDILKTRPVPQHYFLPEGLINLNYASKRIKYPFNGNHMYPHSSTENLITLPGGSIINEFRLSGEHWREFIIATFSIIIANNLIAYIDEDDKWLSQNKQYIEPFYWGRKFKHVALERELIGHILAIPENNPSIMPNLVIYVQGRITDPFYNKVKADFKTFWKVLPLPSKGKASLKEFNDYDSE